jgi:hypothetical protein
MDEFTDREWFRGMAAAAFTLSIATVQALMVRGTLSSEQASELMDAALASAEAQPATRPENLRMAMAARLHLERAAVSVQEKADELAQRRGGA